MTELTTSDTKHLLDLAERLGMPADEALRQVRQIDLHDPRDPRGASRPLRSESRARE